MICKVLSSQFHYTARPNLSRAVSVSFRSLAFLAFRIRAHAEAFTFRIPGRVVCVAERLHSVRLSSVNSAEGGGFFSIFFSICLISAWFLSNFGNLKSQSEHRDFAKFGSQDRFPLVKCIKIEREKSRLRRVSPC